MSVIQYLSDIPWDTRGKEGIPAVRETDINKPPVNTSEMPETIYDSMLILCKYFIISMW